MNCIYKIDGHLLGDIKAFNDYLLKYKRYSDNAADLVFSKRWDRAISCLELARKQSAELEVKYAEARRKALYVNGEMILKATRPYIGVTEFLTQVRNSKGKRIMPEFIADNYWAERYREWAKGNFTEDEIQEFFNNDPSTVTPVDLGNQATWKKNEEEYVPNFGTDIQNKFRQQMTQRWKMLALYGTAIHNVLQTFFSRTSKGNYWYDLLADESTSKMHMTTLYAMHGKEIVDPENSSIKYPGLTPSQIDDVIKYARSLKAAIETQFGKDVKYYPEFTLSAKLNKEHEGRTDLHILGRTDLLVLDSNGNPHIIDYKTSPRMYDDYKEAKKLAFTYQLGTYERMLRKAGLNTTATQIMVAPIQMTNFRNEGGIYRFDTTATATPVTSMMDSLNERIYESETISGNMDEYLQAPLVLDGDTENIIGKVTERMSKIFPDYGDTRKKTDDEIRKTINDLLGANWINKETGLYEFHPIPGSKFTIILEAKTPEDEVKFFNKVKNYYTGMKERNVKKTLAIISTIRKAQQEHSDAVDWPAGTDQWFVNRISKYLNGEWEILEGEALDAAEQFGMILMYNKDLNLVDVVKISPQNLHYQLKFGPNRLNLTGGLGVDDNLENTKSSSLMLKATNGNIEMIEAMLVLNNIRFNTKEGVNIGNITVLAPRGDVHGKSEGLPASNKELLYSWKAINHILPMEDDDAFSNGQIKLLSAVEQCYLEFKDILSRIGSGYNNKFLKFTPALTLLHNALELGKADKALANEALNQLRIRLEEEFLLGNDITTTLDAYSELSNYSHQNYAKILYLQVNKALLEVNGINVRQMTKAHSKIWDSYDVLNDGLSGMMIDNAGQFGADILNLVSGMVLEGYQNARDSAQRQMRTLRDNVEKLKKQQGYAGFKEYTYGNQSSLYDKMTYYAPDGDLLFVNPWKHPERLGGAANVEFLKYALLQFNKDAHPEWSQDQIDAKILDDDLAFFLVPLIESTFASLVNTEGWGNWLKNKFKMFKSMDAFKEYLKNKASEYLSDSEEQIARDRAIFDTVNMMDQGHGDRRIELINAMRHKNGDGYFERNIENLLGAHIWAYATHRALENRMPLLKAAYLSIAIAGNEQNWDYGEEKDFFRKFVLNRVNRLSIMSDNERMFKLLIAPVLLAASWMTLAFSPVLFGYQSLEGIWKDCKLIFTKPDGKESFTVKNMLDAFKTVYKELGHYSDKATVTSSVNALYGINDMDNASFALNNSSDNHGLFNFFGKFAYKFSSRPDFYNRMTIFVALMKNDGSWEAHSIDKNNQLIYNFKKDKRFAAYANDPTGKNGKTEEWHKAKSLYYTIAQLLVYEGATNADGSLFKIGDDLPKAYSNKESEAMKAVGDNMYGYYDSTKKSMFLATFMGSLMMQMQTFWSAKKNQYLGKGGFKVQGEWRVAKDPDGNELYYSLNAEGEIDYNAPLVTKDDPNCSGTKFMQWKGKYEEGILLTLWDMCKLAYNKRSFKDAWDAKWNNEDEDMRKTYQSNLRALFADFIALILLGGLSGAIMEEASELEKDARKSKDPGDVAFAASFGLMAKMVNNSTLDFAWYKSIFEPTIEWKPFSFSWALREYENVANFVTGDITFAKFVGDSMGAARNIKPVFTYLNQKTKE